jgi:hypothetical protein
MERITLARSSTSVIEDPGTLRITVYARRRPWVIAFLGSWFVLWLAGEAMLLAARITGNDLWPTLGWLPLAGFTAAGVVVALRLLWCAFGREVFSINPQILRVRREIGPIGFTREFPFADVHQLHLNAGEDPLDLPAWGRMVVGRGGTSIAFTYRGQTWHFARGLDPAETTYLLNVIRQWTQNE